MTETKKILKPAKDITFQIGDTPYKLSMTFGSLLEVSKMFQTSTDFEIAFMDSDIVVDALNILLLVRDEEGKPLPVAQPDLRRMDLDVEDFEKLSAWLFGHVSDFFIKRMRAFSETSVVAGEQLAPVLAPLVKRATGSKRST